MMDNIRMMPTTRQQTKVRLNNSRAWRAASQAWLMRYPFCVLCLVRGQINERSEADGCTNQRTMIVDHIEPHRGNEQLFWDQNNWETLCRLCHDIDKQRHEQRGGTGDAWRAMLRREAGQTDRREMVDRMKEHLPPGVWGSDAKNEIS
jgi:5-methylcytosine-specific restriction endonuclease McrA